MVKIRLQRVGAKKQPSYRVVVTDAQTPRSGRPVEILGHYNPRVDPPAITINAERAADWLKKGAQPTDRVRRLLSQAGIIPN